MHGFKPSKAHAAAQNFADGGMVGRIKGALGFKPEDPEREKRLADYRAGRELEKQQAKAAAAQPAPAAPQPQKAISSYAAGSALEERMRKAGAYAGGGMVRGKGTGTSDEVPAVVPEGTYIMPADSTRSLGAKGLASMGAPGVPVNLSNGEFKMPPEQVHAVGVQALDQMKGATHTPVQQPQAMGAPQSAKPELFFANGGQVRDPNRPDIPVVGTRGPVRGEEGGGLSRDAVRNAIARTAQQRPAAPAPVQPQPANRGIAGLTANPVTNPQGVLEQRMRMAGLDLADGGLATEEERRKRANFFPGNSPDAGANVYGGAGMELGSSGKLESVPAGIGGNPGRINSFGDAAAAAANPAVTQAPTGIPKASQNTDAQRQALVNQIPRDTGPQAVAQPAQPAQPRTSPSRLYAQDRANEMSSQIGAGNYAGAVGTGVRTAVQGAGVYAAEAADRVVSPLLNAGGRFLGGALGTDTPQGRVMSSASAAPVPSAAAPAVTAPASNAGGLPPPAAAPPAGAAFAAAPDPEQVMPGIYRQGNSYSDSAAGLSGTNTGQPSAQNMAAAQALSDRGQQQALARGFGPTAQAASSPRVDAPQISHSGNSWQARNDLRNARVSANSITENGGRFDKNGKAGSAAAATYAAMLSNDMALRGAQPGADLAAMRENAANGRFDSQQQNENMRSGARNQIDNQRMQIEGQRAQNEKGRYDLEGRAKGFDIRQAERMEGLQNEYLAAQNDPKKAEIVLKKIQALSGKTSDPAARYTAVSGGQEWDAQAGAMRNVPGRVLNNQTGQWVQDGPAPAQAPIGQNPKALAIKNDTKMTTEQKRAALAQLGY